MAGEEGEEEIQQPRTFSLSAKSNLPNFKLRYLFELPGVAKRLPPRRITGRLDVRHHLKRCLSALLNKRLRINTGCFDVSTGAVTSERSVNTYRGLIGVERPIWKFWKSAWHRRLSSHFFRNSALPTNECQRLGNTPFRFDPISLQNRQQFLGKLCPNMARIKIEGVWYEVSRNNVSEKLEGGCELN